MMQQRRAKASLCAAGACRQQGVCLAATCGEEGAGLNGTMQAAQLAETKMEDVHGTSVYERVVDLAVGGSGMCG